MAKAGYTAVTVFDKQPYNENGYSTSDGADAASADLNKVMRLSYGNELLYQRLAFDGIASWNDWNAAIATSAPEDLPNGLTPQDLVWNNCGFLRLSIDGKLSDHERATLANMTREGLRDTQYVIGNVEDERRARLKGFEKKFDPFRRKQQGKDLTGVFDSTAGFVQASKACAWVMHLCRKAGVQFVLGEFAGQLTSFVKADGRTVGIQTADGLQHRADLVILAGEHPSARTKMFKRSQLIVFSSSWRLDSFAISHNLSTPRNNGRQRRLLPATS